MSKKFDLLQHVFCFDVQKDFEYCIRDSYECKKLFLARPQSPTITTTPTTDIKKLQEVYWDIWKSMIEILSLSATKYPRDEYYRNTVFKEAVHTFSGIWEKLQIEIPDIKKVLTGKHSSLKHLVYDISILLGFDCKSNTSQPDLETFVVAIEATTNCRKYYYQVRFACIEDEDNKHNSSGTKKDTANEGKGETQSSNNNKKRKLQDKLCKWCHHEESKHDDNEECDGTVGSSAHNPCKPYTRFCHCPGFQIFTREDLKHLAETYAIDSGVLNAVTNFSENLL